MCIYSIRYAYSDGYSEVTPAVVSLDHMEELTRLEIIHLVDVSLGELEFQLSKGRRSLVAAEKKSYFRTLTGALLYWVSLLLNVIKGHFIARWVQWIGDSEAVISLKSLWNSSRIQILKTNLCNSDSINPKIVTNSKTKNSYLGNRRFFEGIFKVKLLS